MRRLRIAVFVAALLLALAMPVMAQQPIWHGAKHAGTNGGTLVNQTGQLIRDGGACWQGSNGNYVHYAREYGARVGSMAVYDPQGYPITQYPKGASNFANNVRDGRYTPAQMPTGAQMTAAVQSARQAAPGNVTVAGVPAGTVWHLTCPHTCPLACNQERCWCNCVSGEPRTG